jgi:hypothetical protein
MMDVLIGKGNPLICHLTNIIIHIGASLLCFSLLRNTIESKKTAFLYALIFTVHPVLTHAVAWIPGRNDSLLAVFIFSSAIFYLKYIRLNKTVHLFMAGLMYFAALFTKENAILYLPLLLMLDIVVTGKVRMLKAGIPLLLFLMLTATWWFIRANVVVAMPYLEQMQKPGLYLVLSLHCSSSCKSHLSLFSSQYSQM